MKHIIRLSLLILSAAALLLCASCGVNSDVPAGMTRASDEIVDYDLFVPEDWIVDQTGGAVSAYRSAQDPTSVSVMVWALPYADTTLDDWWESYQDEFNLIFREFSVESTESTMLDGVAAQKYVYTGKLGENTYRYTQTTCIRRGSVYLMTFTENAASSVDHTNEFSAILTYFRWR